MRDETHGQEADLAVSTNHVIQGKDCNIGGPMPLSDEKGMKKVASVTEGGFPSDLSAGSKLKEKKKAKWVKLGKLAQHRMSDTLLTNRFSPFSED